MKNNFFLPVMEKDTLRLNLIFKEYIKTHQKYLIPDEGGKVTAFYGTFPRAIWNGGRTMLFPKEAMLSQDQIESLITYLNDMDLEVRMTFTNMLLRECDLNDEYCNMILKAMDNGFGNRIIVASDILEEYLIKNFPNLKLISSITKGGDFNTFKESYDKKYDMVVIHPKKNILKFLEENTSLEERQHIEVLLKSGCSNCPMTKKHYETESFNNLYPDLAIKNFQCFKSTAAYKTLKVLPEEQVCCDLNELNRLGLYNYKLLGRGQWLTIERIIDTYVDSIIKLEYQEIVKNDILQLYNNKD